jgi:hypothetical protein
MVKGNGALCAENVSVHMIALSCFPDLFLMTCIYSDWRQPATTVVSLDFQNSFETKLETAPLIYTTSWPNDGVGMTETNESID